MNDRKMIFASRCGAAMDGDPVACTGTDDRAALQAAIDLLHSNGGGTLVVDGVAALAGALSVPSGIRIMGGHGQAGFCMKANSGGCAIRNAHFVSGYNNGSPITDGSTIVDHNITLENLFINGGNAVNSGNGRHGPQFDAAARPRRTGGPRLDHPGRARSWRICSCITHSTHGSRARIQMCSLRGTPMMQWCTWPAKNGQWRCLLESGNVSGNANWKCILRRPRSSIAEMTIAPATTTTHRLIFSVSPFDHGARRTGGVRCL
jgi:hypothetical protein